MKLTIFQVSDLIDAIENAAGRWDLLREVVMPNVETIKGCTREYMHEVADQLEIFMSEHEDELAANDAWEELQ
jgi:hypothetical protein